MNPKSAVEEVKKRLEDHRHVMPCANRNLKTRSNFSSGLMAASPSSLSVVPPFIAADDSARPFLQSQPLSIGFAYSYVVSGLGTSTPDDAIVLLVTCVIDESAMWLSIMEKLLDAVSPEADFLRLVVDRGEEDVLRGSPVVS